MLPETRYTYSVARVRVAELNMLTKTRLERMIDSDTVSGAVRVLHESGYSESGDYELILKTETSNLYEYLKDISPEPEIFNIFAYRYDSHNIKVLLKSEITGKDDEGILVDNGIFDKNALRIMLRERDLKNLPMEFSSAVLETIDTFARTKDPQIIDILIDNAYYILLKRLAKDTENDFLIKLSETVIDIANINSFIRIKAKMEDLDLLSRVLIEGGSITVKSFLAGFGMDLEGFKNEIKGSGYTELMDIFIEGPGSITAFEKACDDFIIEFARKYRLKAFGIEPLVGYMLGKETDIKNARIILIGKTNRINKDIIRERLRNGYV